MLIMQRALLGGDAAASDGAKKVLESTVSQARFQLWLKVTLKMCAAGQYMIEECVGKAPVHLWSEGVCSEGARLYSVPCTSPRCCTMLAFHKR